MSFFPKNSLKRTLLCTPKKKASVTIETALALPLFIIAFVCFIYMFEMMAIQMCVRNGMQDTALNLAQDVAVYNSITYKNMEKELVGSIGEERLENSIIVGGLEGLDLSQSKVNYENGIVEMLVIYTVKLPVPYFLDLGLTYSEKVKFKRFTGYGEGGYINELVKVYVTETQSVYHTYYHCTHLQLKIDMVEASKVEGLRNEYGSRYIECERCKPGELFNLDTVYVAQSGTAYHSSTACSGLKRTISIVSLEEVIGKGQCQRCEGN